MTNEDILRYKELAYKEALSAFKEKETPIGAVLVQDNKIISLSHNHSLKDTDPTEHAEMNVLKEGFKILKTKNLSSCSLFITLEPCLMCLGGIISAHLKDVYYFALDPKKGAFSFYHVDPNVNELRIHYLPDEKCGKIVSDFFKVIRKK